MTYSLNSAYRECHNRSLLHPIQDRMRIRFRVRLRRRFLPKSSSRQFERRRATAHSSRSIRKGEEIKKGGPPSGKSCHVIVVHVRRCWWFYIATPTTLYPVLWLTTQLRSARMSVRTPVSVSAAFVDVAMGSTGTGVKSMPFRKIAPDMEDEMR